MATALSLVPHLSLDELGRRYRGCGDPIERTRWHALWLFARGWKVAAIAGLIGLSDWSIRKAIHRYNAEGPAGVVDRRRANRGRPRLLSAAQQDQLLGRLAGPAPDGGLWTGPKVAAWMSEQLGRPVSPQQAWQTLKQLGYSLQRPRPRHPGADPAAQEAFKKRAWQQR